MNRIVMTRSQMCELGHMMPEILLQLGRLDNSYSDDSQGRRTFTFYDPTSYLMNHEFLRKFSTLILEDVA